MNNISNFRYIKTLEDANKVCKLAFGRFTEIAEIDDNGLKVRFRPYTAGDNFHILNDFETDASEEKNENLRFAMALIYGEPYFTDLKQFMHDEYFAKPFNKISQRVAVYKAEHNRDSEQ